MRISSPHSILALLTFLVGISITNHQAFAQNTTDLARNSSATFNLTGSAKLLSHYVEKGLSQTNESPALQGSFWFNMGPQFRFGLWGSNVNYKNGSEHLVLKPSADIKVSFTQNTDMVLKYSQNIYYSTSSRNGNTIGAQLNTFGYRINYEMDSNWEGTNSSATYFSVGKPTTLATRWIWDNEVGYTMLSQAELSNFFNLRTGIGTKAGQLFYEASLTTTSNPGQFDGSGNFFIAISALFEF